MAPANESVYSYPHTLVLQNSEGGNGPIKVSRAADLRIGCLCAAINGEDNPVDWCLHDLLQYIQGIDSVGPHGDVKSHCEQPIDDIEKVASLSRLSSCAPDLIDSGRIQIPGDFYDCIKGISRDITPSIEAGFAV